MGKGKISTPASRPGAAGPGKKLGSLNSFQAILKFNQSPAFILNTVGPARTSRPSAEQDSKLMPPPPPGVRPKARSNGSASASTSPVPSSSSTTKAKVVINGDVVEILSSDEEVEKSTVEFRQAAGGMWTDSYAPTDEAELAPGKNRIAKVKNWLYESLYGVSADHMSSGGGVSQTTRDRLRKYRRILLLTGPAGTGKTTTVKVLAKQLGIDVVEWSEGVEERSIGSGFDRESSMTKLSSFLSRHSYAPLALSDQHSSSSRSKIRDRPRLLLLTSLPNLTHLPTRQAFHSALLSFCQTYTSASCPLVIVHSEAGSGGKAEESWMNRDRGGREGALELVGREVRDGPWCQEVDFISLAPTFVTRALNRVLQQAIPQVKKRPPASAVQLIALTSNGDLRSAMNTLQLLCTRQLGPRAGKKRKSRDDEESSTSSRRRSSGKGSRGGKGAKLDISDDLRAVLDAVTRREQSLNLFHALGKVFYNKRLGDPGMDEEDQEELARMRSLPVEDPLPVHLKYYDRPRSMTSMESFVPSIPIDASSFALWIHQSLPAFCTDIEQISNALDSLCGSDIMRTDDDVWQSSTQSIAYALHLIVSGTLLALPSPVPRNHQKIIKPHFFESSLTERDNLALLDTASEYITKKAVSASVVLAEKGLKYVTDDAPWGGLASRTVLAAELIPMMVNIQGLTHQPLLPSSVKPLSLPPYSHATWHGGDELKEKDLTLDDEEYERSAAGEDGLGSIAGQGWDDAGDAEGEEEEGTWLQDDDIEDWD